MSERDDLPSLGDLDDYLLGVMSDEQAEAFEEALFTQAARGEHALVDFVEAVGVLGRVVMQRVGSVMPPTAESIVELRRRGFKVEVADATPGVPYQARWSEEAEIVVTHFVVDLRGRGGRFDVEIELPDGTLMKTLRDVTYDPNDGSCYAVCEAALARLSRSAHVFWKLYETVDGQRTLISSLEQIPAAD
jgi:hypothetical protein